MQIATGTNLCPLTTYGAALDAVRKHVNERAEVAHVFHGPAHWQRVEEHARAISHALGISPIVPVLFALVHDFKRIDDSSDPWHGPRAAQFVKANRARLFSFLTESDWLILQEACEKHSDRLISDNPILQACWDADRLDLNRIGKTPDPKFMGSAFAKRPEVIRYAAELTGTLNSRYRRPQGFTVFLTVSVQGQRLKT